MAPHVLRFSLLIAVFGVSSALPGQESSSFEPAHCERCYEGLAGPDPGQYAHMFGSVWGDPGQVMDCHAFNACHGNSQPGRCSEFHFSCSSLAFHKPLEEALARGDYVEARLALAAAGNTVLLRDRRLVFLDCGGRVQGVKLIDRDAAHQLTSA